MDYGKRHDCLLSFITSIMGAWDYFEEDILVEHNFNEFYDEIAEDYKGSPQNLELLTNCLPQFKNMMRELKDLEVRNIDIHAGNFGISNGVIKLLDVGYRSSDGVLEGIKVIEL